jgi:hypothetical protein
MMMEIAFKSQISHFAERFEFLYGYGFFMATIIPKFTGNRFVLRVLRCRGVENSRFMWKILMLPVGLIVKKLKK